MKMNTQTPRKELTQRGIKSMATRAALRFETGRDNFANGYSMNVGEINLNTIASGGDNVPWAKSLFYAVAAAFEKYGYKIDHSTVHHCQGNVSGIVRLS